VADELAEALLVAEPGAGADVLGVGTAGGE
jgi:hypothetical protein